MQFITQDKLSVKSFAAAGRIAREYIAAAAVVWVNNHRQSLDDEEIAKFDNWESSMAQCASVGSIQGLVAAAEGSFTREQLMEQFVTSVARDCTTEGTLTFLERYVACPSERRLPLWAVLVRQARPNIGLVNLFKQNNVEIHDVELEVTDCFNIVNRALADLMVKMRIPMGRQNGRYPSSSIAFRSAHLWLLSDFFHNVLPTMPGAWLDSITGTNWDTIWTESNETQVLVGGSDQFSNALATSYFLSPEWIAEDSAMRARKDLESTLDAAFLDRLEKQLSRDILKDDVAVKLLASGDRPMGTTVFARETVELRQLKLYFLSFNWLRLYNFIMAIGFRIYNLYRVTEDADLSAIDDSAADQVVALAKKLHSRLGINTRNDVARAGLYGKHEAIVQFIASLSDA